MPSGALARRRLTGRRAVLEWALVGVLSALVVIVMINGRLAERADFLVYDSLIRLTANEASEEIVIVAIDDRSLAQIGRWPWPRERHTELVRQLAGPSRAPSSMTSCLSSPIPPMATWPARSRLRAMSICRS